MDNSEYVQSLLDDLRLLQEEALTIRTASEINRKKIAEIREEIKAERDRRLFARIKRESEREQLAESTNKTPSKK